MKPKLLILIVFFFSLFTFHVSIVFSQPVQQEWLRTYTGGQNDDILNDMVLDTNGNVYVTGYILTNNLNEDFCTIKYNTIGTQQWVAIYNGPANLTDEAIAIAVDKRGNAYVTGESFDTTGESICTIKYSSIGTQVWVARYSRTPHYGDGPTAIAIDKYCNVYVTGASLVCGSYSCWDYLTLKYDSNGVQQWVRFYSGPGNNTDIAHSIAVDDSSNVYITGESFTSLNSEGFCTIKYNTNGDSLWVRRFDGAQYHPNIGKKLVLDKWSYVYVTGYNNMSNGGDEFCTIKYNPSGSQQWVAFYLNPGGNGTAEANAISLDSNLNIIVSGYRVLNVTPDYSLIKYNNSGSQQWVSFYNGPSTNSYDESFDNTIDQQNNVYETGRSQDINQNWIFMTIKYDSSGTQKWQMSYPGAGAKVKVDKYYNVYVGGSCQSGLTTIKYSQLVGVIENNFNRKDFKLNQNFPNPFNPRTNIEYQIPFPSYVKLSVYDILGREIKILINKLQQPGNYIVEFNGNNLSSGTYFYSMTAVNKKENYNITKRMILIK